LSFPGGRIEPTDASPRAAALRETEEEVGLHPSQVHLLGFFREQPSLRESPIYAFVGLVESTHVPDRPASDAEVEELLQVPIGSLLEPGRAVPQARDAYRAVAYEARTAGDADYRRRIVHYWTLRRADQDPPTVLWGLTAETVAAFLETTYGWRPPSPARIVAGRQELQP
jgi:8-oxo-dGTP pyrophosphatase MutT (NUDIX family)